MARKKKIKVVEEPKNCLLYLSTDGDLFHADEREKKQRRYIMEYANAHNIHIVKSYHRDVAAQAIVDRHFDFMVEQVRQGKADGIIVANMKCISRSLADAFHKVGLVVEAGGVMISVDDPNLNMTINMEA